MQVKDRLQVTRELGGPRRVVIYWELIKTRPNEGWKAYRTIPNRPHTAMPEFDCPDILSIFKLMRDILCGKIGDDVLMK